MTIDTSFWGLLGRLGHRVGYVGAGVLVAHYTRNVHLEFWQEVAMWLFFGFSVIEEMAWFHEDEFEVVEEKE